MHNACASSDALHTLKTICHARKYVKKEVDRQRFTKNKMFLILAIKKIEKKESQICKKKSPVYLLFYRIWFTIIYFDLIKITNSTIYLDKTMIIGEIKRVKKISQSVKNKI
jgi:hypothetical protein